MSIPGWKNFTFFDKEGPAPSDSHDIPDSTTCCTSGDGELVFGCQDGTACAIDSSMRCSVSWQAHSGPVAAMKAIAGHRLLVTVGDDDAPTLKLWDLSRRKSGAPELIRGVKLFQKATEASQVTQLAVHFQPAPGTGTGTGSGSSSSGASGGHQGGGTGTTTAAVGLACGDALLIRGDMVKDRLQRARVRLGPPGDASPGACTGLELADLPREGSESLTMFGVTEKFTASAQVLRLLQVQKPPSPQPSAVVLEDDGAPQPNCCCLSPQGELVIGRTQAVFFYEPEGRGACFVVQGEKKQIKYMRRNLVVLSGPSGAATKGLAAGMSISGTAAEQRLVLSVQDLKNKLCAAKVDVPPVRHLAVEFGKIVAVLEDGGVLTLRERELPQKLTLLFRKNMYSIALQLAEAEQADAALVADVQRRHGDHLYSKTDYDAAMAAYVETVGHVEPSYVIRRFLDVQRIHNLTRYLEALHQARQANSDHTTLLLNCYTKLKDIAKLDDFIRYGTAEEGEAPKFDTETAVRVCRAAGYYEHALHVALMANEPNWYLDVLVEDCGHYSQALSYIEGLPHSQAAEALQKYGKALVNNKPEAATALVMKLCTPHPVAEAEHEAVSVAAFAHLYADRPLALMLLCEFILNSSQAQPHLGGAAAAESQVLLYHTLMDLYLAGELKDAPGPQGAPAGGSGGGGSVWQRREKALALLKTGWPHGEEPRYDAEHMLVLCRMHEFPEGLLFLYEQKRLYREVLGIYMAAGEHSGLIEACIRLGDAASGGDPQLWTEVLAHFAGRPSGDDCTSQLKEVLDYIEAGELLPPLVVLQTLAKNSEITMGIVKEYIGRQLAQSNTSIQADRESIAKYQAEAQRMRAEVEELQTKARVYQASKCALTGAPLELPAIYFLCGHSFSSKSLGENDTECPLCSPQHRTVLDIRRSMRAGANEQDKFFTQLKNSADGFSVIAEFFGRGLVNSQAHKQAL